jgi:acyl carrier protein
MREQIITLVKDAVTDLNDELQYESLEQPTEETILFGGDDGIDSLSLVRLVVDLEQRIQEETGKKASLADERAMSARRSPYRSVGALTDFIIEGLGE